MSLTVHRLLHEEIAGAFVGVVRISHHAARLIRGRIDRTAGGFVPICVIVVLPGVTSATVIPAEFLMIRRIFREASIIR